MGLYSRWVSFAGLIICLGLLGFAAYLQLALGLMPCPLCVLQRIFVVLLALVFFIGSLYTPTTRGWKRFHSALIIIVSLVGALVATRHLWLEHHPPVGLVTCSPTLQYMLQNLSFNQTLALLLNGSGDCAKVTWQLWGLSIPGWTLILFAIATLFGIWRFMSAGGKEHR